MATGAMYHAATDGDHRSFPLNIFTIFISFNIFASAQQASQPQKTRNVAALSRPSASPLHTNTVATDLTENHLSPEIQLTQQAVRTSNSSTQGPSEDELSPEAQAMQQAARSAYLDRLTRISDRRSLRHLEAATRARLDRAARLDRESLKKLETATRRLERLLLTAPPKKEQWQYDAHASPNQTGSEGSSSSKRVHSLPSQMSTEDGASPPEARAGKTQSQTCHEIVASVPNESQISQISSQDSQETQEASSRCLNPSHQVALKKISTPSSDSDLFRHDHEERFGSFADPIIDLPQTVKNDMMEKWLNEDISQIIDESSSCAKLKDENSRGGKSVDDMITELEEILEDSPVKAKSVDSGGFRSKSLGLIGAASSVRKLFQSRGSGAGGESQDSWSQEAESIKNEEEWTDIGLELEYNS